ncbi:MAG: AsmA family protein [Alistipes sp.]|nr:AsmA family protein [Alistipes sp.]
MKKVLKIFAIVLAVLIAVIIAVPALLSDKIGDIVKSEANKMLNAKVEFEKLDISLISHFPKASLELVNFSVTGIDAFEDVVLVAGKRIEVAVDVLSLFGESFEISKVWLLEPQIHGVVLKDGKVNWDIMKPSEPEVEEVEEESESTFKLSINSVNIEGADISYDDNQSNMHFKTAPVSLSLSGDLSAASTTLFLKAAAGDITFVSDGDSFASGLTMALDGAIGADFDTSRYTLSKVNLSVNSVKAALDGWVEMDGDDIVTDITLDCSDNDFKSILSLVPVLYTKDFKNLTASGDVSLTGAVKGRLSGDKYPAFDLKLNVAKGSFKYADLPKAVSDIAIVAAVANRGGTLDATTVNISKFGASFGGQTIAATLKAATPFSDLGFDATLKGKIDLGAIKDIYPLEDMALEGIITADAAVAGHMSDIDKGAYDQLAVSGQLGVENIEVEYGKFPTIEVGKAFATLSPSKMALESLEVKIGQSDISASGNLTNYWGYLLHDKTLSGRLDVKSQLLDLNELMASLSDDESTEAEQTEQPEQAEQSTSEESGAIEVPKNLNLVLDCNLGKVLYDKMVMENLAGTASVKDGVLSLDNLGMNMFDGKAKATAAYSTSNIESPRLGLDAVFSQASFKKTAAELELVEKLVPLFEQIAGNYTMSLKCDMLLDKTMSPQLGSVNGSGKITSGNFKLSDVPALNMLSKLAGNGVDLNKIEATEVTVISFMIENGNIVTKPFDINLGKTKLTLSGLTGLDQSIDYNVAVALPQMTLHGKIGGTFSKPKVTLDTAKSVEAALEKAGIDKEVVEQKVEQKVEQVKEQVVQTVDTAKQKAIAEAEAKAAQIIETARNEANKLVEKATNPIAKIAAKAAADKLIAEAEKQAQKIIDEARK